MVTCDQANLLLFLFLRKKTPDSQVNEMIDLGFNFYQSVNFSRNFTTCGLFASYASFLTRSIFVYYLDIYGF